jgi:putative mRNA 3-end processing factor
MIIAPPSAQASTWLRRFGTQSTGFASGWMMVRGARRQRAVDRGFVLSDHADWPELLTAIRATEAETVYVTTGLLRRSYAISTNRNARGAAEDSVVGDDARDMLDEENEAAVIDRDEGDERDKTG